MPPFFDAPAVLARIVTGCSGEARPGEDRTDEQLGGLVLRLLEGQLAVSAARIARIGLAVSVTVVPQSAEMIVA